MRLKGGPSGLCWAGCLKKGADCVRGQGGFQKLQLLRCDDVNTAALYGVDVLPNRFEGRSMFVEASCGTSHFPSLFLARTRSPYLSLSGPSPSLIITTTTTSQHGDRSKVQGRACAWLREARLVQDALRRYVPQVADGRQPRRHCRLGDAGRRPTAGESREGRGCPVQGVLRAPHPRKGERQYLHVCPGMSTRAGPELLSLLFLLLLLLRGACTWNARFPRALLQVLLQSYLYKKQRSACLVFRSPVASSSSHAASA